MTIKPLMSIVIPVYKNEATIGKLVAALVTIGEQIGGGIQGIFVVDASPDGSAEALRATLPDAGFDSIVIEHARNFGSFAAIRTGLAHASGRYIGIMAADLQEPPELMAQFVTALQTSDAQVVVGTRRSRRGDRKRDRWASQLFWRMFRRFVIPSMPVGGVDVFACTSEVRDKVLEFREANSSLVGLLFWLGFRTTSIPYDRIERADGGSSTWTFRKKFQYMTDSVYSFTDLPLRMLRAIGTVGLFVSVAFSVVVAAAHWRGDIEVKGYTPMILAISISTMLILSALGIVGSYVWRTFENTKQRPLSVVERIEFFESR